MKKINTYILIALLGALFISCNKSNINTSPSKEEAVIEQKIDSLLSIMTVEEKIGQTVLYSSVEDITGPILDKNYTSYLKNSGFWK